MKPTAPTVRRHADALALRRQFQSDVLRGLALPRKSIPCKYFYDARGSALFEEICGLDEYYLTRTEMEILRASVVEIAQEIGPHCELIEPGSGSGLKTRLLLSHLHQPSAYFPVDISRDPLERSARDLARLFPGLRVIPVHADFTVGFSLPGAPAPGTRRVVFFPGSTVGNFNPQAAVHLLHAMARVVRSGGGLLIGFDLDKPEAIVLPAYNDRLGVTARFNLNLLARINRELGADFDLEAFSHRAVHLRSEERVEMLLISRKAQLVRIAGREFRFAPGESIHTEDSYKYTLDHFGSITAQAGFALRRQWLDAHSQFCVQYLVAD
jgi:dimethylhistidine N-methyltransferase